MLLSNKLDPLFSIKKNLAGDRHGKLEKVSGNFKIVKISIHCYFYFNFAHAFCF